MAGVDALAYALAAVSGPVGDAERAPASRHHVCCSFTPFFLLLSLIVPLLLLLTGQFFNVWNISWAS